MDIIVFVNRPFRRCLLPLFLNESRCKTFLMKIGLICMKMNWWVFKNSFSNDRLFTWTRIETENDGLFLLIFGKTTRGSTWTRFSVNLLRNKLREREVPVPLKSKIKQIWVKPFQNTIAMETSSHLTKQLTYQNVSPITFSLAITASFDVR